MEIHRDQVIVERFNRTLAERLFGHHKAVEMRLPEGQRSSEWVVWLPAVVSSLNGEVTRSRVKTRFCHQRKGRLFQALHPSSQTFSPVRDMAPLRGGCVLSLPARRAWGRKEKSHSSDLVFESVPHRKNHHQTRWTDFGLFAPRPQTGLRSRGASCRAYRHRAAASSEMIFDRLRVDAVLATPIICRSRRSAPVFFADRCTSPLLSFSLLHSWLAVSTTPSSAALNRSQHTLVWRFKLRFEDTFTFLFSSSTK